MPLDVELDRVRQRSIPERRLRRRKLSSRLLQRHTNRIEDLPCAQIRRPVRARQRENIRVRVAQTRSDRFGFGLGLLVSGEGRAFPDTILVIGQREGITPVGRGAINLHRNRASFDNLREFRRFRFHKPERVRKMSGKQEKPPKPQQKMVPTTGLEPVRCYSLEPESSASANSATWALRQFKSSKRTTRHARA